MKVAKRTFEALKYPAGSEERARLNLDNLTSEYYPSHKYCLRDNEGHKLSWTFRTKRAAEFNAHRLTS